MGGKPKKSTPADLRLKRNKDKKHREQKKRKWKKLRGDR